MSADEPESEEQGECRRKLEAMGFDVGKRNQQAIEKDSESGFEWSRQIECIDLIGAEIHSPDDLINKNKYSLSDEESGLFCKLPAWHRAIFENFPGEWEITKQLFPDDADRKGKNYFINQWLIKCSISLILHDYDYAPYLWERSEWLRGFDELSGEMEINNVCVLVFPFVAYQDVSREFEDLAESYFSSENIKIDDLESALASSLYFSDLGVLVAHVWRRYLDDKQAYVALYQESVKREVFGGKTAEPEPHKPDPPAKQKHKSTGEKEEERRVIYAQVVAEYGRYAQKGVVVEEAARRAGCSEKTMRAALLVKK